MVCTKNFATKSDLMLHKRLYIRKKKICALCNFCNKTLEQKNLKIHEQFHHKTELKQSDVHLVCFISNYLFEKPVDIFCLFYGRCLAVAYFSIQNWYCRCLAKI